MFMNCYDVIIVGAGPSGSSCAKELNRNGVKTLLIDKNKFPRIKSCCGFLTNRAISFVQENFGLLPIEIFCSNKQVNFLWSSTGINYNSMNGYDSFANVDRSLFDNWLVQESKTEFHDNCELKEIEREKGKITLVCDREGFTEVFKCSYLVCAGGSNSFLRRAIDKDYSPRNAGASIQKIYTGHFDIDKNNYYVNLNRKFTDNAFSYFFFKGDEIHIGTGWTKKYNNYFDKWYEYLVNKYKCSLRFIRDERCCVEHRLNGNKFFFGEDNILFVGESASLIENWGIGITCALVSGQMAAKAILNHSDLIPTYKRLLSEELAIIENTFKK